ncbi:GNAT family N-acetyltransferase [Sphingobacterium anhuiense]|uniref:GNAT family N-acetyltransferase n=1 Tax=Sphingobacterium anhuiense TaxID=493780 RepID=A0ABW5YQ09_9SPHI
MSIETKSNEKNQHMVLNNVFLKYIDTTDTKNIHKLRTDPEVNKFMKRDLTQSLEEIQLFIKERMDTTHYFTINTRDTQQFAGTITLWRINSEKNSAELGYALLPEFQGKGLMSSAIKLILNYAIFTLKLNHIEAKTVRDNLKSRQLLEKNGFILLHDVIDENNADNVIYTYNMKQN